MEATKAYAKLLEIEPDNDTAKTYLREMYEKRRDWDNLLKLMKADAEHLDGDAKTEAYREIAKLATERTKPDICAGLWDLVLESDPNDPEALAALVQTMSVVASTKNFATCWRRLPRLRLQMRTVSST